MPRFIAPVLALLCVLTLAGCSHSTPPPVGRWEGAYDGGDTVVVARFEITAKGLIFISAPNAENIGSVSDEERAAIHRRLADGLADGWGELQPHPLDFDGKTFRLPGGIAPQAEWDAASKRMTLIVYLNKGDGIRIPLRTVRDFSANPFLGG